MDDRSSNRRELIETYLAAYKFCDIRSRDEINLHFCMNAEGARYDLAVEREWLDLTSDRTIAERLDGLELVPFLRRNKAAWVGVTATGQEVITHMEPDAKS